MYKIPFEFSSGIFLYTQNSNLFFDDLLFLRSQFVKSLILMICIAILQLIIPQFYIFAYHTFFQKLINKNNVRF